MGDLLFLAHRAPFPPDRGDKIRGFHLLRHLARRRRVHLIAFADDPRDLKARDGLAAMVSSQTVLWRGKSRARAAIEALATRRPISLTAFDDRRMRAAVETALNSHAIDTIFVFSGQMAQYLPPAPRQRVVMDFVDMDSAKFEAYAGEGRGPMAWLMRREAHLLMRHERAVAARADASLFVSRAEAEMFVSRTGADRVEAVENGIDTDFFDPAAAFRRIETTGRLIVFTGQMDYRPNIDAVRWFAQSVLPYLRLADPQVRFAIVGRSPTDAVRALGRIDGVTVTGEVDDVRGWLAAAAVVVAPLKLARGVQNKVLEAMAMARPVVASPAAAEGIDHQGTLAVAGDVAEQAATIGRLLADPEAARLLGARARARVIERYGWDARLARLDAVLAAPLRPDKQARLARATAADPGPAGRRRGA